MLVWIAPSHVVAAATRPLCHFTTQLLYQGSAKPEERSQDESNLWTRVQAWKKKSPVFRLFPIKIDLSCAYSCLLQFYGARVICMEFSLKKYRPQSTFKLIKTTAYESNQPEFGNEVCSVVNWSTHQKLVLIRKVTRVVE